MDHSTPTDADQIFGRVPIRLEAAARQIRQLEINAREFGIELLGLTHEQRGIVHIVGPELGLTRPGRTIVCGDSHTSTHGAFGALAFGIGSRITSYNVCYTKLLRDNINNRRIQSIVIRPGCRHQGRTGQQLTQG